MAAGVFYRGNGCGYEPSIERGAFETFKQFSNTKVNKGTNSNVTAAGAFIHNTRKGFSAPSG